MIKTLLKTGLGLSMACLLPACQPVSQPAPDASASAESARALSVDKDENRAMAAHSGVAERQGDVLTISSDGTPIASFTDIGKNDCEGFDSCSIWSFAGVITLQSVPGKSERFVRVQHFNGEIDEQVLVATDGTIHWTFGDFAASEDGRYLAAGSAEGVLSDGYLRIVDFASPGHSRFANFDAQCDVTGWTAARTIAVICSRNESSTFAIAGTVSETSPGTWRLLETRILKKPEAEKVELRSQIVKLVEEAPSKFSAAELAAYDQKAGYKRLAEKP